MPKGALFAAMDFSPVDAGEFHDWYDTEHLPERQRVPGFVNGERWIGADNPNLSVATYDLDDVSVLHGPDYNKIGGANLSPWSKRITAKVTPILRYEGVQIVPGEAIAPMRAGGLLLVGMTPAADVEADFHRWYDNDHLPALAAVPGVFCARRFRTSGRGPKFIALYHLNAPGVIETPEWQHASSSTSMPQHVRDKITDRLRLVCRQYSRA